MLKVILIDDEQNSTEMLEWQLKKYCPQVEIVGMYNDPKQAVEKIKITKPDLIFLDIEMPHMNGFELIKKFDKIEFDIIFTTAYDQFAVKAFKISALDYLLKPIDKDELIEAVAKAERKKSINNDQIQMLLQNIQQPKQKLKRLALTTSDSLIFVDTDKIVFCESDSNYTFFHLVTGDRILVSKTLKDVEEMLEGSDFFRVHNSYLINMNHIKKFTRGNGGYVVMSNGAQITVSRRKKEEFFEMFSKF